jgi:hypothetical protein
MYPNVHPATVDFLPDVGNELLSCLLKQLLDLRPFSAATPGMAATSAAIHAVSLHPREWQLLRLRSRNGDPIKAASVEVVPVIGHTDSVGAQACNERPALRRANSVRNGLVSRGMDAVRVRTESRGKTRPIADNATEEGRARNRRVEVQLTQSGSQAGKN